MENSDLFSLLQWWMVLCVFGIVFLPTAHLFFNRFYDSGYVFAKTFGLAIVSYIIFLFNSLHVFSFTTQNIYIVFFLCVIANVFLIKKSGKNNWKILIKRWPLFLFEELLFLSALFFWALVRAYQPDIHGLEKYMDFGFINSILRTEYFPAKDMWLPPHAINYYYYGHFVTAVLTKISLLPSYITYNLMVATIFALTVCSAFSFGANFFYVLYLQSKQRMLSHGKFSFIFRSFLVGILCASIMGLGGNLHTLYTFFQPYVNDNPKPPWELTFQPYNFPNSYWYPNATRFIYNTIHEFPIYSFVVSDLHGHVLDIPFVLLIIAILFSIFLQEKISLIKILFLSFLLSVMYMTNVWDSIIYFLLTLLVLFSIQIRKVNPLYSLQKQWMKVIFSTGFYAVLLLCGFILFSLPFSIFFKPFVSGIGIICAPDFLMRLGTIGPFLFEPNHCQRSPLWQIVVLYGFFYFWVIGFLFFIIKKNKITETDIFILFLTFLSTLLIIIPEFIYAKDIYPAHYRANTMFKLVYQSFIMLSLCSGYIIIRLSMHIREIRKSFVSLHILYLFIGLCFYGMIMIYPNFAIKSYYNNFQNYAGLNGIKYIHRLYPNDYKAILWINESIDGQPVMVEAQGDSYTDYERISANTGLPTILGWTVHEWLWRGSYDIPSTRIPDVKTLYETTDSALAKEIIKKYNVSFIFIGDLERQKYPNINEKKFEGLGKKVFQQGSTRIYKITGA